MSDTRRTTRRFKTPNRFLLLGVSVFAAVGGLLAYQIVRAEGRIIPNVTVGGISVGNMSPEKARVRLEEALRAVNLAGVEFIYEDKSVSLTASDVKAASAQRSVITYDIDVMVNNAFLAGESKGRAGFIMANLQALFSSIMLPAKFDVDRDALSTLLAEKFGGLERDAKDADVHITPDGKGGYRVLIESETIGTALDYRTATEKAVAGLARWQGGSYALAMEKTVPKITQNKAELMKDALLEARERGEITLGFDDITWKISGDDFMGALTLKAQEDGTLYVGLRESALDALLDDAKETINQEPRGTKLKLNEAGDRAIEFVGGQVGRTLNRGASVNLIDEWLADEDSSVVPFVVDITSAPDSDTLAEELGIRELLGYGTSNFAGSPMNRRKNIKNGVEKLWGWIIAPGEEFGLLEKLKPFDVSGGYVQELVIKDDRTIREYGGGLCQIGTTTFRAVMGAGLPITQRQNHSYSVSYYAPAGTDATLYDPAPDFKFVNDTKGYMIFTTHMLGDILRFEFWGTRDGRVQDRSEIEYWNYVDPPEEKLIPTSALEPGKKRCFEVGHKGLSASFDYTITYPDGRKDVQTFRSKYKPWQSQCLIGTEGAPNIKLEWDGSLKEYPPEGPPIDIKIAPEENQCTVGGGCAG